MKFSAFLIPIICFFIPFASTESLTQESTTTLSGQTTDSTDSTVTTVSTADVTTTETTITSDSVGTHSTETTTTSDSTGTHSTETTTITNTTTVETSSTTTSEQTTTTTGTTLTTTSAEPTTTVGTTLTKTSTETTTTAGTTLTTTSTEPTTSESPNRANELQNQIYILSGVFGGVCFLSLVAVTYLFVSFNKVKKISRSAPKNVANTGNQSTASKPPFQEPPKQSNRPTPYVPSFDQRPNNEPTYAVPNRVPGNYESTSRPVEPGRGVPRVGQPRGLRNYDNYGY